MKSHALNLDGTPYQPPLTHSFRLADWKVLPELNRLEHLQSAEQVAIEPRLMHLLCFLAANQGSMVDRDTLVSQLWPTVVVNENSLTRAVSELRKHLRGKSGDATTFIETIPKKGYRLIPLNEERTTPKAVALNSTAALYGVKQWARYTPKALVGAALAASLTIFAVMPSPKGIEQTEAPVLASLSDELIAPQISYLGGEVQLSASELSLNQHTTTRPILSYDGASFAYLKYDNSGSTVYFGTLSDSVDPLPIYHHTDRLLNLAWSPTGDSLLFARQPTLTTTALFSGQGNGLELLTLNLASREVRRLVKDDIKTDSEGIADQNLT